VGHLLGANPDTCLVRALRDWLAAARITERFIFQAVSKHGRVSRRGLHRDSIGAILRRAAARGRLRVETLGEVKRLIRTAPSDSVEIINRPLGLPTWRSSIRAGEIVRLSTAA
jgi:hypothetical protein